jgi:outer membrane protein OmpA-like peptidoglycan-associated protein
MKHDTKNLSQTSHAPTWNQERGHLTRAIYPTLRLCACAIVAIHVSGCAKPPPKEPLPVFSTTQVDARNRNYVFCEEDKDCKPPTEKFILAETSQEMEVLSEQALENRRNSNGIDGNEDAANRTGSGATLGKTPFERIAPTNRFEVHFAWGMSILDPAGKREVDTIIQSPGFKAAKTIHIAGRTDPSGSPKANRRLAQRRADTVKQALVRAGASQTSITSQIQEPCCSGKTPDDRKPDRQLRRADVVITLNSHPPEVNPR